MSYQSDLEITVQNKSKLSGNKNLLLWYEHLFSFQFEGKDVSGLDILEVGSGTSPLKIFYPNVITSDILSIEGLDFVFDCHKIGEFHGIQNSTLDLIVLTNVLHHLQKPLNFLINARTKLKDNGSIIITEPYFSWISSSIYRFIHHEAVDSSIKTPELKSEEDSPLSSANVVLPYLVFFKKMEWLANVNKYYQIELLGCFSSLSYFVTGGISKCFPIPHILYKIIFKFDRSITKYFPRIAASFFTVKLTKKKAGQNYTGSA